MSPFTPCPKPKPPKKLHKPIPRKKKRTAAEMREKREREYGPPGYHEFVTSRPCCACGVEGFSEFAHVGNEGAGTGRKANGSQGAPLCGPQLRPSGLVRGCHLESHDGQATFEARRGVDLNAEAAKCWTAWLARCAARVTP